MATAPYTGSGKAGITCLHCEKVHLSHHHHDNWNCRFCHSGYLSVPMLAHLLPRELMEQVRHPYGDPKAGRACPLCQREMAVGRVIHGLQSVELEQCRSCNLVWFDSGKLVQLVRFGGDQAIHNAHAQTHTVMQELLRQALHAEQDRPEPRPDPQFVPWASVGLFIFVSLLAPYLSHHPEWLEQWSFSAASPFRGLGLTWLTSILFNHRSQMMAVVPLVFFGYYVERKMGTAEFLKMFFAAGIAARILYLGVGKGLPPLSGTSPSVAAVVGYGLLMIPYRDFLFPSKSYKSPMQTLQWLAIGVGGLILISVLYDQVNLTLARINRGADNPLPHSDNSEGAAWMAIHGIGLAVGWLWAAVVPPAPPAPRPLRKG